MLKCWMIYNKETLKVLRKVYLLRKKSILACINLLRIKNYSLLKLITVNQMLEDSKTLFYENYHPLWFVTNQINLFMEVLLVQQWEKQQKLKRYAKPLHRLTQRQVKKVMVERSAPCCRNTLQKFNVSFVNMF